MQNTCGTPGFIAPEILKSGLASEKSDIFSVGTVFYTLITRGYDRLI